MSANNQRLRSAIQRIAREDTERRDSIAGNKNRGGYDSTSVRIPGAEDDRQICCDGSTGNNRNPGSDTRDPEEQDGLDEDDPAGISDDLTGVVDCATGQPICFEGSDWIPPEGWEDAQSPPMDPDYEEGFFWGQGAGSSTLRALTPSGLCAKISALRSRAGCGVNRFSESAANCKEVNPDSGKCLGFGHVYRYVCSTEPECQEDPPLAEGLPEDGCVNLAVKDGAIVGSKYDPENDGSYSAPRKEIELCDAESGASTLIRADTGSTWKSIKSLEGDIDPDTQSGYLYDTATGKKIRQISPSEFRDNTV